jgi:hypothetical protein
MLNEARFVRNPKNRAAFAGKFKPKRGINTIICWVLIIEIICDRAALRKKFRIRLP